MAITNDQPIAVLNGLIETTLDSAYGYREAAGDARNPAFKGLFEGRWLQRKQLTADLHAEVRGLGGTPDEDGTMLAATRRIFFNRRNTMAGSDQNIIDEVEAGENHIKAKFESALAAEELPTGVKAVATRVLGSLRADHDQMRDLKHALQAQSAA
jgi:uncharacterized protein (TIGR02284 family)